MNNTKNKTVANLLASPATLFPHPINHHSLFSGTFSSSVGYSELEPHLKAIALGLETEVPVSDLINSMWNSLLQNSVARVGEGGNYYCIQLPHLITLNPSALKDEIFTTYPQGKYSGKLSLKISEGGVLRWNEKHLEHIIQPKPVGNQPPYYQIDFALEDLRFICSSSSIPSSVDHTSPWRYTAATSVHKIKKALDRYWGDFKVMFNDGL